MPTITKFEGKKEIVAKTMDKAKQKGPSDWWNASDKKEMADKMLSTVLFLRERNQQRIRQASMYSALYSSRPLAGMAGVRSNTLSGSGRLRADRPTMSVITSCVDTIVSKMSQDNPRPFFLGDNSDYKQRQLATQMNQFIMGEFYQTRAYDLGEEMLRDACILGTGVLKVLEDDYERVSLERRLETELLFDSNDAYYGKPSQMYELKLVERSVLYQRFPKFSGLIELADEATLDTTGEADRCVSDLVLVAEGWHLKSGPDAKDGMHVLACSAGVLDEEEYDKKKFPFVFMKYAPCQQGMLGQGLPERLMGTQIEINKLLYTISRSINLMGVPRIFIEKGSAISKASFNNEVGSISQFTGTPPIFSVAECMAPEVYAQLQRLIQYAYEQEGISQLSATSQKPSGLNSGEAIRSYDNIQTDRFAALQKRYQNFFIELAYQMIDKAMDICKRTGNYQTVFPDKDGTRQIDIPKFKLLEDPFVIRAYNTSTLPKDPAGRLEKVVEMMQASLVTPQEGRRLLDYPDIEQEDKLANAGKERILKIMDAIVEDGDYTPPDAFMDLALAQTIVTQYYNLYMAANLDEKKAQLLRDFFTQVTEAQQALQMAQQQQAMMAQMPQGQPMASPTPSPTGEMLPNIPAA